MHIISRDTPALYLTAVAKDRLPVFRTDALKIVTCNALDEARKSAGISIYAYVIMPDHLHFITDAELKASKILRFVNGITSRRVIDHLKERGHNSSLLKLRHEIKAREYRYSLWDHHNNMFSITSEDMFMQKVNYIHLNPVRAGLVKHPDEYHFSSARLWHKRELENEPLITDHANIKWRSTK